MKGSLHTALYTKEKMGLISNLLKQRATVQIIACFNSLLVEYVNHIKASNFVETFAQFGLTSSFLFDLFCEKTRLLYYC